MPSGDNSSDQQELVSMNPTKRNESVACASHAGSQRWISSPLCYRSVSVGSHLTILTR
jgi:hypothetical protein